MSTTHRPSVGQIVHYVSHGTPVREDGSQAFRPACRAEIVTEVDPTYAGRVGLAVLNPTGQFYHSLDSGGCELLPVEAGPLKGGTWHWPEEV
ncbi:hypothetical protein PH213_20230 [Streptomyces sp. SRF1]|uniref:hypothetical protein n=1 Tax=Streptomyces sp. SRF1 TaxID=1549642 RepID=UPI0025AFBE73|nr:hypothetical protein [Streptomyces sp. SRF1]MDN3056834.1 hypothetical protein [Streptomyces sp. SRF1]